MIWLDLKLGGRMLLKYPGLTVVGGIAMAFAIWAGIVIFQMVSLFLAPTLPLSGGERIVEIRTIDVASNDREARVLNDFLVWRDGLTSVTDLSAWRDSSRNLIVTPGDARPVHVAEMSASGFRVAQADALLGRVLTVDDERASAPAVAVISYDVWRSRLGGDTGIVGRTVQLGNEYMTVVGVMREGFAFPVSHDVWLPLRTALLDRTPRSGPELTVFGVLAPGATLETAQTEIATFGQRAAADYPATHEHLQARVSRYADMFAMEAQGDVLVMSSIYFFVFLLLVLIFGNVGLLLFARAATREGDLIVRTALGASRGRIVGQIFAEALVLGGLAAVVGVGAADFALRRWGTQFLETNIGRLPFWFDLHLSASTVLVAVAMTVIGAAVAGVLPALKLTRGMGDRLKQTTAGSGGLRFGGVWTVVIVAQVAVTVAFPGLVYWEQFQLRRWRNFDPGFAAEQYLTARIEGDTANGQRFSSSLEELRRQVAAQPGVAGVTFSARLPSTAHPAAPIEMGYEAGQSAIRLARLATIDPSYFDVLQASMLAGRPFTASDLTSHAKVAIVDQAFVDQVLQGRNPIGQQVRFARTGHDSSPPQAWLEIVGVVKELGVTAATQRGRASGLYLPATPDRFDEVYLMAHVRGADPMTLGPRLRELAVAVDPSLRLVDLQRASEINDAVFWVIGLWLKITVVMSGVALVLSLAGIFAVLSFAVTRRTREIGLRVALGGTRGGVIATIFRRPLLQVGLGVIIGTGIIFAAASAAKNTEFPGAETGLSWTALGMLAGHAAVMFGVCMLACVVPARRALSVQPTVALRAD